MGGRPSSADPTAVDHYVYRILDDHGTLLYVGCSLSPQRRIFDHYGAAWFPYRARMIAEGPYTYDDARRRERIAINTEGSFFNRDTKARRDERIAYRYMTHEPTPRGCRDVLLDRYLEARAARGRSSLIVDPLSVSS